MSPNKSLTEAFPPPPLQTWALPLGALLGGGAAVLAYINVIPEVAIPWLAWPMAFANSSFIYLLFEILVVELPYVRKLKGLIPEVPEPNRVAADSWFRLTLEQGLPLNEGRIYQAKYHDEKVDKQEQSLRRQFGARRGWMFFLPVVMVWTGLAVNRWPENEAIVALYGPSPTLPLMIATAEAFLCLAAAMVLVNRVDSMFAKWNSAARVYCGKLPHQDLGESGNGLSDGKRPGGGGGPAVGAPIDVAGSSLNSSRASTPKIHVDLPTTDGDADDDDGDDGLRDEDDAFDPLEAGHRRVTPQTAITPPPKPIIPVYRDEESPPREPRRSAEPSSGQHQQPISPQPPRQEDEDEEFDVFR